MAKAKRARKVETLKQPSLCLRLRAPYFYPDIHKSGSERGVKFFYKAEYCGTPQSKERRNGEYKACLNERALRLLDCWKGVWDVGVTRLPSITASRQLVFDLQHGVIQDQH